MLAVAEYKDELRNHVASTQILQELLPLLNQIPLEQIKDFLYQKIGSMNDAESKTFYYESLSIDEILPTDIIRDIISYQGFDIAHTKCVNKQWKELSDQNEKKNYQQMEENLEQTSPIKFNKNENATWVLHPDRTDLTLTEINMGFEGITNDLQVFARCSLPVIEYLFMMVIIKSQNQFL